MSDSIKAALSLLLPVQEDFVYEDIDYDKNGNPKVITHHNGHETTEEVVRVVRGYSHDWQVHLRETDDKQVESLYSGINAMAKTPEEKQLAAWLIHKNILPSEIYNVMTQLDENVSKLWRSSLLLRIRYLQYIIELINFPSLNKMLVHKFNEQNVNVRGKMFMENHMAFNRLSINILELMIAQAENELKRRSQSAVASQGVHYVNINHPAQVIANHMGVGVSDPIVRIASSQDIVNHPAQVIANHMGVGVSDPSVHYVAGGHPIAIQAEMYAAPGSVVAGTHVVATDMASRYHYKNAAGVPMTCDSQESPNGTGLTICKPDNLSAQVTTLTPIAVGLGRPVKNPNGIITICDTVYDKNGVTAKICRPYPPDKINASLIAEWHAQMNNVPMFVEPCAAPSSAPSFAPSSAPLPLPSSYPYASDYAKSMVESGRKQFEEYIFMMRILVAIVVIVIVYFLARWLLSSPKPAESL